MCESILNSDQFRISQNLTESLYVAKKYEWLLKAYVLDFYVDDHWYKLPLNWQRLLECLPLEALCKQLQGDVITPSTQSAYVWPLELLALSQLIKKLCINRKPQPEQYPARNLLLEHHKLRHVFRKGIKPKKWHEITRMAAICAHQCQMSTVDFVVDFGAGLGHLARILGYGGYGIKVCCLEIQADLNAQAAVMDKRLESMAAKHLTTSETFHFKRPTHITERLSSKTCPSEFLDLIRNSLQLENNDFRFGIIGLHACGDLSATLIRLFLNCKEAQFISFVGCCYQKLSTIQTKPGDQIHGYPLSRFLQRQVHNKESSPHLSYEAREISCHAIETFHDRLIAGKYEYLKIHSFRAAAERIIISHFPDMKHSVLRGVKHMPGMKFNDYFYKTTRGTEISTLDKQLLQNSITETDLLHWRRIVIFYTLRLMLAPLVESIILYDRILYLLENDCQAHIEAIFDPRLSPRNHITTAVKL